MTDQTTPIDHDHDQPSGDLAPLHTRFLLNGRSRSVEERAVRAAMLDSTIVESQLVPWGSNYTFAIAMQHTNGEPFLAIYKPEEGAAPLWDFPYGTLYRREYAAYLLSRFLGWRFIPPTVVRDGPHGIGTVQLYIEPEPDRDNIPESTCLRPQLEEIAIFDIVANNADRKASHFFVGRHQRQLWGIDHGLTFNLEPKLRTIIWDFAGESVPDQHRARLQRLERHQQQLFDLLEPWLEHDEILMICVRAEQLLRTGTFPMLRSRRNIPFGW
jgi:hypothetical protein